MAAQSRRRNTQAGQFSTDQLGQFYSVANTSALCQSPRQLRARPATIGPSASTLFAFERNAEPGLSRPGVNRYYQAAYCDNVPTMVGGNWLWSSKPVNVRVPLPPFSISIVSTTE